MEDFVTYEIAVRLKEKGFSEKCLYHYIDNKLVSNTCKSDNDNITTEDLLMSCNYLVSQFDIAGSNVVASDAPTISQVLKWLREERGIFIHIDIRINLEWYYEVWSLKDKLSVLGNVPFNKNNSYEQAAIAGIEYVLNNLI